MSNVTIPGHVRWMIPQEEHTDAEPFCGNPECLCHYDPAHLARHFVEAWLATNDPASHDRLLAAYWGKVEARA